MNATELYNNIESQHNKMYYIEIDRIGSLYTWSQTTHDHIRAISIWSKLTQVLARRLRCLFVLE